MSEEIVRYQPNLPEEDPEDYVPPRDIDEMIAELPEKAREFIGILRHEKTVKKTCKILGCSLGQADQYKRTVPGFRDVWKAVSRELDTFYEDILAERAVSGMEEQRFNAAGELMETRIRQDPSLLKSLLGARMPTKYGSREGNQQINIVITRTAE